MMDVTLFESMNDLTILAEEGWARNRTFSYDVLAAMLVCEDFLLFGSTNVVKEKTILAKTDQRK